MNTLENNLPHYFGRLCKHYILVKENGDYISYMDLCHSLRCLIDIKKEIDFYYQSIDYKLKFKHIANIRKLKKNSIGEFRLFFDIKEGGVAYNYISYSKKECSDEDFDNMKIIEPIYENKKMTLTEWAAVEIGDIYLDNQYYPVTREKFIRRISNKYGGSHPYETEYNDQSEKNIEQTNIFINKTMVDKLLTTELGFLIIREMSEEIIKAFLPLYLKNDVNCSYDYFLHCHRILFKER